MKPYILLSTPRSGSSPVYHTLTSFLEAEKGIRGVEEILNPHFGSYREEEGRLMYDLRSEFQPEKEDEIFERRLSYAQKYHGKIFFKIFPSAFKKNSTKWLLENFDFIVHERQDKFQQVLSFLTSISTDRWYELRGSPPSEGSLIAKYEDFKNIEGVLFHFNHLKKLVRPVKVITHEEFVADGPDKLLFNHGFIAGKALSYSSMPKIQNEGDKLRYFSNPEEILDWYKSSFFCR